jgi:hypothetical protein
MAKAQITATISKEVYEKWKKFCDDNCINASQLIERLIKEHLKKQKKGKK